jgi:hypothetical protein
VTCVVPYDPGKTVVTGYDSGTAEVRAFLQQARGNGPPDGTARAFRRCAGRAETVGSAQYRDDRGVLPCRPRSLFITGNANEISDLDSGVHTGWARTGQSFKGYAIGSSGGTTRRPVCRAYGSPAVGLDSHFYSASPDECIATLQKRFRQFPRRRLDRVGKLAARGSRGVPDGFARSAHRRLPGWRRAHLPRFQSTYRC